MTKDEIARFEMLSFYLANSTQRICMLSPCIVESPCFCYIVPAVSKVTAVEYSPYWCRKCKLGC